MTVDLVAVCRCSQCWEGFQSSSQWLGSTTFWGLFAFQSNTFTCTLPNISPLPSYYHYTSSLLLLISSALSSTARRPLARFRCASFWWSSELSWLPGGFWGCFSCKASVRVGDVCTCFFQGWFVLPGDGLCPRSRQQHLHGSERGLYEAETRG